MLHPHTPKIRPVKSWVLVCWRWLSALCSWSCIFSWCLADGRGIVEISATWWALCAQTVTKFKMVHCFNTIGWMTGRASGMQKVGCWFCWWWRSDWSFARLIAPVVTPLPSSLAPIKQANPGSPGKMAVKTGGGERQRIPGGPDLSTPLRCIELHKPISTECTKCEKQDRSPTVMVYVVCYSTVQAASCLTTSWPKIVSPRMKPASVSGRLSVP